MHEDGLWNEGQRQDRIDERRVKERQLYRHGFDLESEIENDELVDEKADKDRGRTQKDVIDKAHDHRKHVVAAIFREISAAQNSDRRADDDSQRAHDETAAD